MAVIGRTVPTVPAASVSGSRMAAGARNVATVDRAAPIEELSPKLGASLDDARFLFPEYERGGTRQRSQGGSYTPGILRSTSQAFAAFLEFERGGAGTDSAIVGGTPAFAGLVSRAINIYETNARVVSGSIVPLGQSLSITL